MIYPNMALHDSSSKPLTRDGLHVDPLAVDFCRRVPLRVEHDALLKTLAKRRAVHFGPSLIMDNQAPEMFHDEVSFRLRMEEMRTYMKQERMQRRLLSLVMTILLVLVGFLSARLLSWRGLF